MRIITLIAGYRDDPHQIARVAEQGAELGPVVVLCDYQDRTERLTSLVVGIPGCVLRFGRYEKERDKRNALLVEAVIHHEPGPQDWYLTLDPDEKLLNGDMLPLLLDRVSPEEISYPLPRLEPNGDIWVMPCKLFRATVTAYSYLDIAVRVSNTWWNLDPWQEQSPHAVVSPGYPMLQHFRSPRADGAGIGETFYSEPDVLPPDLKRPKEAPR